MGVGGNRPGFGFIEPLKIVNDAQKSLVGLQCFQVADVLAEKDQRPDGQGHGAFQMAAHRQDRSVGGRPAAQAEGVRPLVVEGQTMIGGETVIAELGK